jgi:hypothetical protein
MPADGRGAVSKCHAVDSYRAEAQRGQHKSDAVLVHVVFTVGIELDQKTFCIAIEQTLTQRAALRCENLELNLLTVDSIGVATRTAQCFTVGRR